MKYYEDPILGKGRVGDDAQKMTTAQRQAIIIPAGKLVYDTDTGVLYYGNGEALGGVPLHTTSTENSFVYGIDKDMSTSSTAATKVVLNHSYDYDGANTALRYHAVDSFAQTPAHSFRSVLRDLANGVDVCTLDVSDSTKKSDGTALTADEKLGKWTSDGVTTLVDFMVRIPVTYWRIDHYSVEVDGQIHNHVVWLVRMKCSWIPRLTRGFSPEREVQLSLRSTFQNSVAFFAIPPAPRKRSPTKTPLPPMFPQTMICFVPSWVIVLRQASRVQT